MLWWKERIGEDEQIARLKDHELIYHHVFKSIPQWLIPYDGFDSMDNATK